MLQVAKSPVDLLGAPGTGAAGKIPFLHENSLQTARGGVLSDSGAGDPPANHKQIHLFNLVDDHDD